MVHKRTHRRTVGVLAAMAFVAAIPAVSAHEIPNDVTIQTLLKAEGSRLRVITRVPLIAMRDITWPLRAPRILDLSRANPVLEDAAMLWIAAEATFYEGNTALPSPTVVAVRATPRSDRSFESFDEALARVTGPRETDVTDITINDDFLDVLFEYPIQSDQSRFSIDPRWGRLGMKALTVVRLVLPDGGVRVFELEGDPGLVRLDPTLLQVLRQFVRLGFQHLVGSADALLVLAVFALPFRRAGDLAIVFLTFATAATTTLIASSYGFIPDALWFAPLIDTLLALSIVYLALENLLGTSVERRWRATFGFGLAYGFAFSFALHRVVQFAGEHVLASLVVFDVGLVLGQLLVLALLMSSLFLLFRFVVAERLGTILISALAGHTGWHWLTARSVQLWQYQLTLPALTPAFFADVVRWLMLAVAIAAVVWLISTVTAPRSAKPQIREERPEPRA